MTKRMLIALFVLILASVLLIACRPEAATEEVTEVPEVEQPTSEPTEPPAEATEVPTGVEQEPLSASITLDPAAISDDDSLLVNSFIYEGLVRLDGDTLAPALATSWTISEDGMDYIFYLRPNVIFHDGTAFNADAVVANFNRWFDPASPLRGSGSYDAWKNAFLGFKGEVDEQGRTLSTFDGIEKVDDLTVLIHLNRPDRSFLLNLALIYFGIASPAALEADVDGYGSQGSAVAGTGPYYLADWSDDSLTLLPNESYWGEVPAEGLTFPLQ